MSRIASSLYEEHFQDLDPQNEGALEPSLNVIKFKNNLVTPVTGNHRTPDEWRNIFAKGAFFEGNDVKLGYLLALVYEDPEASKISTVLFTSLGELCMNSLTLDTRSRFYVACENLTKNYKESNVRRALAISLLRAYSVYGHVDLSSIKTNSPAVSQRDWDETMAGEVASNMTLVSSKTPLELGEELLSSGFLQPHFIDSTRLDVVYQNSPEVIESNNKMVFLLGKQLEQLFDPLTEYSPELTRSVYTPPDLAPREDTDLVKSICHELFDFQENITTELVQFLKEVVIPMRIKVLNGDIAGVSAAKLNQVFPPTLDEVTRVNCMFLETLKVAIPYGSFETLKACAITIPYFYKAYMRHEAAMKSFSQQFNDFMELYSEELPPDYPRSKVETVVKALPNLTKIKQTLDRIYSCGNWKYNEMEDVKKFAEGVATTVESFGREDPKPYNRRVFTPTGKILTEICEGWPSILAYGWLNRKVISVADSVYGEKQGVIILFNDYIIFTEIERFDGDEEDVRYSPNISDILMNSLTNEKPIKKIPNLKVLTWTSLNNVEVSYFNNSHLDFLFKDDPEVTINTEVKEPSKFINLLNKAQILGKSTPFHLFKNERFGLTLYATAHEKLLYDREQSRSNISLFLNFDADVEILKKYNLFAGIFAEFKNNMVQLTRLTQEGEKFTNLVSASELSAFISEEVCALENKRRTYQNASLFSVMASNNVAKLKYCTTVKNPPTHVESTPVRKVSDISMACSVNSRRLSSLSSSDVNKPLPRINRDVTPTSQLRNDPPKKQNRVTPTMQTKNESQRKQSKIKNRLSQIFGFSKKKNHNAGRTQTRQQQKSLKHNMQRPISTPQPVTTQQESDLMGTKKFVVKKHVSNPPTVVRDFLDEDTTPEVETFDDCKTFESSMSAIFDDGDGDYVGRNVDVNIKALTGFNWTITRENSSVNCNLDKQWQLSNSPREPSVPRVVKSEPLFGPRQFSGQSKTSVTLSNEELKVSDSETHPDDISPVDSESQYSTHHTSDAEPARKISLRSSSTLAVKKVRAVSNDQISFRDQSVRNVSTPSAEAIATFLSSMDNIDMDESFTSTYREDNLHLIRIGVEAEDESGMNDIETFTTPKISEVEGFDQEDQHDQSTLEMDVDTHTPNQEVQDEDVQLGYANIKKEEINSSTESFRSCMSNVKMENGELVTVPKGEEHDDIDLMVSRDESFKYLAGILDYSVEPVIKKSETFQSITRSYSSYKYLSVFIDSEASVSSDLYKFLQES